VRVDAPVNSRVRFVLVAVVREVERRSRVFSWDAGIEAES
jgi:hypothetical protein